MKDGVSPVWDAEIVDKAPLHAERAAVRTSRPFHFHPPSKYPTAIHKMTVTVVSSRRWSSKLQRKNQSHPVNPSRQKTLPHYQIGSADPELAVKVTKNVMNDVSGINLNCSCPIAVWELHHSRIRPAVLELPALRNAMPPETNTSAKIRLLLAQEDTLKPMEGIFNTGVSALTVYCRRNMRKTEGDVKGDSGVFKKGKGAVVIENGDCLGYEDGK